VYTDHVSNILSERTLVYPLANVLTKLPNKIDEKGTLKATEYDKYENITGSVLLSLFMGTVEMHKTAHAV
jgi:hypothetical protein